MLGNNRKCSILNSFCTVMVYESKGWLTCLGSDGGKKTETENRIEPDRTTFFLRV